MSNYSEQVKQDAAKAASDLRKNGWTQGSDNYDRFTGPCCAQAAIIRTNGLSIEGSAGRLYEAFRQECGAEFVTSWNDQPGRTKEEVLEVFDRIANS